MWLVTSQQADPRAPLQTSSPTRILIRLRIPYPSGSSSIYRDGRIWVFAEQSGFLWCCQVFVWVFPWGSAFGEAIDGEAVDGAIGVVVEYEVGEDVSDLD